MARIHDTGPICRAFYSPRRETAALGSSANPLADLQEQRDKFALAMRVGLGKDGFQLIARRLPGYFQLPGCDIGRSATRDDAGELRLRRCQAECLGEDRRGRPWSWPQGI